MKLLTTFPLLVVLLAPSLLAQDGEGSPQCASCCPPVEDPVPDTVACETLDAHLVMMEEAIEEAECVDSSGRESDEVCHAITMKAIPPCMLMEGTSEQAECLAKAAEDIEEELGISEVVGTEVVANCKCDAFKKIRKALSSVRDMMCPPSDDGRSPRNYYGYGANTLWFQYILCQQESIPSLACWLFTSGWNQADFGQYYLYDNLLGDDDIGISGLDGDLLPLLVLSGGLGAGAHGGPAYSVGHGHGVYRREVTDDKACPTGKVENENGVCVTAVRKRRGTTDCPSGQWKNGGCVEKARKCREDCPSGQWKNGNCVEKARKRREECLSGQWKNGDCVVEARKRREDCPSGQWKNGNCVEARKRREDCLSGQWKNGDCVVEARKRREDCPSGQWKNGNCVEVARKRREDCSLEQWKNGDCEHSARKRRETTTCAPGKVKNSDGECVRIKIARKRRNTCPDGRVSENCEE